MEKVKSNRMISLIDLYDMQSTFFNNVLDGISDNDRHNRLNTPANHIAWLTGSMVEQRFDLARVFGSDLKQTADNFFRDNKGIQNDVIYPSLDVFREDWKKITPVLKDLLVNVADEKLDSTIEMMPGYSMTLYDISYFSSYREANCIGQIALWRRLLGYEPMKYM